MRYLIPDESYKHQLLEFKEEFAKSEEIMSGSTGLSKAETFEEWLSEIKDNFDERTVREGRVPASTFIAISKDKNELIGIINIRHMLNDALLKTGGHIAFSIKKDKRAESHENDMMKFAINYCKKIGMNKVLITCTKENELTRNAILKNGGELENEVMGVRVDGKPATFQRYWVRF